MNLVLRRNRTRAAPVILALAFAITAGCGSVDTLEDLEPNDTEPGVTVSFPMNYECDAPVVLVGEVGGEDPADHYAIVVNSGTYYYDLDQRTVRLEWLTADVRACLLRPSKGFEPVKCLTGDETMDYVEADPGETLVIRVDSVDGAQRRYQVAIQCLDDNSY